MSNAPSPKLWPAWLVLGLVIAGVFFQFVRERDRPPAPLPIGELGEFQLLNQDGDAVAASDLHGRAWLANVIFTRCPGPCMTMTRNLAALRARLPDDGSVGLLSFTSDPEFDTPEVLRIYAKKHAGAGPPWHFLTGDKDTIYALVREALKLALMEKPEEERESEFDLNIHSTLVLLIDRQGRVISHFKGADEHDPDEILAAVRALVESEE